MFKSSTIDFLRNLKDNNNKEWFEENRQSYDAAKSDFLLFIQRIIEELSIIDNSIQLVKAKDCIFRINRDVRFSNDKSPYKTNFGAFITRNGKKAMNIAGYYFHLEPSNSFAGGGMYIPMSAELKKIRQAIYENYPDFIKIIESKPFSSVFNGLDKDPGLILKRHPKGFDNDNPAAEYLKYKSFTSVVHFANNELISNDLLYKTLKAFEALKALNDFLNNALK